MRNNEAHLKLAVGHLNAPYGQVLTVDQLAQAFTAGTFQAITDQAASSVARQIFVELDARIIYICATEAGSKVSDANNLYLEALTCSLPRVEAWEQLVRQIQSIPNSGEARRSLRETTELKLE